MINTIIKNEIPLKDQWELLEKPYILYSCKYVENQNKKESNARTYAKNLGIAFTSAEGIFVKDSNGNVYIDCLCGAGALPLGHNHEVVNKAIERTINDKIPLMTLDITTPIKDKFMNELFAILPENMQNNSKIQFCSPCGTDAVEAAIKLVKTATKRSTIFSFFGAYHGMSHGSLALTGNKEHKKEIGSLMKDVVFIPFPYHYRCPFGIGGKQAEEVSLRYIRNILEDSHSGTEKPAAFILETIQGEGGCIPASEYWLKGIHEIAKEYSIPLIVDEVQSGIGRTGHYFSFQDSEIIPDVIVISKAIGGSLPLALIIYNENLDVWDSGAHAGTFRGNQLAMTTGLATLNYIKENNLLENVKTKGSYLINNLKSLKSLYPFIGEVRGRGLMIGIEIVNVSCQPNHLGTYPPNPSLAKEIKKQCLINGLIIETGGREDCVLRMLPPLNITQFEIDNIMNVLETVFYKVNT